MDDTNMNGSDYIAALKTLQAEQQKHQSACPHCGYCPHCGRSAAPFYPAYPTYPNSIGVPWYPQPYIWCTSGGTQTLR